MADPFALRSGGAAPHQSCALAKDTQTGRPVGGHVDGDVSVTKSALFRSRLRAAPRKFFAKLDYRSFLALGRAVLGA